MGLLRSFGPDRPAMKLGPDRLYLMIVVAGRNKCRILLIGHGAWKNRLLYERICASIMRKIDKLARLKFAYQLFH
ncbi:hypothetical protein AgCh_006003 [Apium graveolens]